MRRHRSMVIWTVCAPGRRATKGWGGLLWTPTRQRVAVAAAGRRLACDSNMQGVTDDWHARLNRRASTKLRSWSTPMTRPAAPDFKASSIAHSASRARAVSTNTMRDGSRPSASSPGPYRCPISRAIAFGQHHRRDVGDVADAVALRRTARRNAKPIAAAQPAASLAPWAVDVLISWTLARSRPIIARPPPSAASSAGIPNVQHEDCT